MPERSVESAARTEGFRRIEQSLIALNRDYTPEAGTDLATLATNYTSAVPFRLNRTDKVFSDMLAATLK